MDLLKFMMELDIWKYMIMKDILQFMIELIILWIKQVILQIVLIRILQEPEPIYITLYLRKNIDFS